MSDFTNVAGEIGTGLGSILNPILGGTTTQTVTEKPASGTATTTIIVIVIVVAIIAVVGFMVYKQKR